MRGRLNRLLTLFAVLGALVVGPTATQQAAAASSDCSSVSSGGAVVTPPTINGGNITFDQAVHVFVGKYCSSGTTSTDASWSPPACWWQPIFTPQQLHDFAHQYYQGSSTNLTWGKMLEYYETDGGKGQTTPAGYKTTDGPPYSNWNIGSTPGGEWWSIVFNEDMMDTPQFSDCLLHSMNGDGMPWSWVATGAPAPAGVPVVSQEALAEYGASIIQLPASDFQSSPQNAQTVNLPMWMWAGTPGGGPYRPQNLTACSVDLDGVASLCATVTATADSFTVDPGTPNAADAQVFDRCTINADGTVGTPYTGQSGNPPCGVMYLHSTVQSGHYYPSVTVKWRVAWNGGGGGVWPKFDTMPGNTHQVTVQEIQSVVGQ